MLYPSYHGDCHILWEVKLLKCIPEVCDKPPLIRIHPARHPDVERYEYDVRLIHVRYRILKWNEIHIRKHDSFVWTTGAGTGSKETHFESCLFSTELFAKNLTEGRREVGNGYHPTPLMTILFFLLKSSTYPLPTKGSHFIPNTHQKWSRIWWCWFFHDTFQYRTTCSTTGLIYCLHNQSMRHAGMWHWGLSPTPGGKKSVVFN